MKNREMHKNQFSRMSIQNDNFTNITILIEILCFRDVKGRSF